MKTKAQSSGASTPLMTATSTIFNGVDLATQPFLTKRGRKINHIVKRVFVIPDGYLFYFQHAVSIEPCGVIPLENSEFFIHSYASTAELSNFCFELRTSARLWGGIILDFHKSPASKVREVEQTLEATGARNRHEQFFDPTSTSLLSSAKVKTRTSRPITLSGLSSKMLWPRCTNSAATLVGNLKPSGSSQQSSSNFSNKHHSFLGRSSSTSSLADSTTAAATASQDGDSDTKSFICQTTSGGRQGLLRVQKSTGVDIRDTEDGQQAHHEIVEDEIEKVQLLEEKAKWPL